MKDKKRYQDCNRLVKMWRHRHYIPVPFKWLYHQYLKPFLIYDDDGSIDRGLAFGYNLNDPLNTNISYTQSVWRAQLGFVYKF